MARHLMLGEPLYILFDRDGESVFDSQNRPRMYKSVEAFERTFRKGIDGTKLVEYEPVIRCKDCMWWKTNGCWFHQPGKCVEREPNDFCSDGQRRMTDA